MYVAHEHGAYLYVNFTDYLDTGLFIDHRNMREIIKQDSRGKNVLNLFAYTCTASVHSAMGGAKSVTSVDLSANYLNWGKQNFALNGLDLTAHVEDKPKYDFIATDVFEWLKNNTEQFELIFIDPPTFSNSKKFKGTFDVQRDHVALISRAMNRLTANGVLYFSNNFTKFELSDEVKNRYDVVEMTDKTIGVDFNPKKPIHQSFKITHKNHKARVYEVQSDFDTVADDWREDVKAPQKSFERPSKDVSHRHAQKSDKPHFKKDDFKKSCHDKKGDGFKGGFKETPRGGFKDKRADAKPADDNLPSTKPKIRYEKIDGKMVAVSTEQEKADKSSPKKYTVKPKSSS